MFERVLIANRGEIACRVIRTLRSLGIRSIAVCSEADRAASFVQMADEVVEIGPAAARDSYLRGDKILEAALRTGAQAIHPGYGFLSENAEFARACRASGICFIGPSPEAISAMGLKDRAKKLMEEAGVPVVPGYHGADQSPQLLAAEALRIGYPVLIKAVAGGGGKGMRRVDRPQDFAAACEEARRESLSAFGDDRVLIEKYLLRPRHIEVQVFADAHGQALHLFERDCSLQRRHQKVIEEAPAPGISESMRRLMGETAVRAALAIGYEGAGTVEFIADVAEGLSEDRFYFMEMNTRLQVEHPVTECITGLDLVEWQLRVASAEPLPLTQAEVQLRGHAIEARLYAEDPENGFLPQTGELLELVLPEPDAHTRIDSGVMRGDKVSVFYDPMIAKIIAFHDTRELAARSLARALAAVQVLGLKTNVQLLSRLVAEPKFRAGDVHTGFLGEHAASLLAPDLAQQERALFLLCVGLVLARRKRADQGPQRFSPWSDSASFLVNADALERFELVHEELRYEVALLHRASTLELELACPEAKFKARGIASACSLEGTQVSCMLNGERLRGRYAERDGQAFGALGGISLRFLHPFEARAARASEAEGAESSVKAPMPGKITRVFVEQGTRVERGMALLCLEAMKMEHTLKASFDGVVESLKVRGGEQVEAGCILLHLAEPTASGKQGSGT